MCTAPGSRMVRGLCWKLDEVEVEVAATGLGSGFVEL